MSMQLPSSLTVPATPETENEDAVRVSAGLAVVVDGAGVAARFRAGCVHSPAWYAHELADSMFEHYANRGMGQRESLSRAISHVRTLHGPACDLADGSPAATIAAFRVNGGNLEYLVQGDAAVYLRHAEGGEVEEVTDRLIDRALAKVAVYRQGMAASGLPEDTVEEMGWFYLEQLRNDPSGFWTPQDDPTVADHAVVGIAGLSEVDAVIACSEGITRAIGELGFHDAQSLVSAAVGAPLSELVDALRTAEAAATEGPGPRQMDASIAVLKWS